MRLRTWLLLVFVTLATPAMGDCNFQVMSLADFAALTSEKILEMEQPFVVKGATGDWPIFSIAPSTSTDSERINIFVKELSDRYGDISMVLKHPAAVAAFGTNYRREVTVSLSDFLSPTFSSGSFAFEASHQRKNTLSARLAEDGMYSIPKAFAEAGFNTHVGSFDTGLQTSMLPSGGLPFHCHGAALLGLIVGTKDW